MIMWIRINKKKKNKKPRNRLEVPITKTNKIELPTVILILLLNRGCNKIEFLLLKTYFEHKNTL